MGPVAVADVISWRPGEVEREWILEDGFVAVGRKKAEQEPLTRRDLVATDFDGLNVVAHE